MFFYALIVISVVLVAIIIIAIGFVAWKAISPHNRLDEEACLTDLPYPLNEAKLKSCCALSLPPTLAMNLVDLGITFPLTMNGTEIHLNPMIKKNYWKMLDDMDELNELYDQWQMEELDESDEFWDQWQMEKLAITAFICHIDQKKGELSKEESKRPPSGSWFPCKPIKGKIWDDIDRKFQLRVVNKRTPEELWEEVQNIVATLPRI